MEMYTQEWIDSLPTLAFAEAIRDRVKYFRVCRGCKTCGCDVRVCTKWAGQHIHCANCLKLFKHSGIVFETYKKKAARLHKPRELTTCGGQNAAMSAHNKSLDQKRKENWVMPRVFGGMNTK